MPNGGGRAVARGPGRLPGSPGTLIPRKSALLNRRVSARVY